MPHKRIEIKDGPNGPMPPTPFQEKLMRLVNLGDDCAAKRRGLCAKIIELEPTVIPIEAERNIYFAIDSVRQWVYPFVLGVSVATFLGFRAVLGKNPETKLVFKQIAPLVICGNMIALSGIFTASEISLTEYKMIYHWKYMGHVHTDDLVEMTRDRQVLASFAETQKLNPSCCK